MVRISLPRRVGLIVLIALMAGWVLIIAVGYVVTGAGRETALPKPKRLAALAEVFERTEPEGRSPLLAAVQSRQFTVQLSPKRLETVALPDLWPTDAARLAAYRAALGDRPFAAYPLESTGLIGQAMASALNAVEFRIGLADGQTLIVVSESPMLIQSFGLPVGFGAALLGVAIALVTLIALDREIRPLSNLAAAVDRVDPLTEPVDFPQIRGRSPEIRALAAAFERLQGRIATLIRARMALLGGIQHDLRTFATRLRLRIDKISDPVDRARAVADIGDMIALLDDALLASRAGASELDEELIDLFALVGTEVADRQASGAPVDLTCAEGDATVLGDRLALRRIVANLTDNALRYGQVAHLGLALGPQDVVITVDDEGPGIPADQRSLLLEPFTRQESSRARKTGGAGLGLAVVRSLAEAHGGAVEIGDAPAGGARLTVRLPLFQP
ncbi:MAG: ATP-binding protein [Pseudomonadota bacterium]